MINFGKPKKVDHGHHHNCNHDHHNDHGHQHSLPKNINLMFIIGVFLNSIFVIIEGFYGYWSNSLALIADAGHNLSDVAGLLIAWGAIWLATKKPTPIYTFGFRKSSIFSAFFNATFLMIAVGIIIWEALHRLWNPISYVESKTVIIIALIGVLINSITAFLFLRNKEDDINLKSAYLHMAADALISLGVVFSGVIIYYTAWFWLDPLVSIIISLFIIYGCWDLFKNSIRLSMAAVPSNINPSEVKKYFESLPDVVEVHDLHIWAISSTETALSAHLTVKSYALDNKQMVLVSNYLEEKFKIHHPTIQIELYEDNFNCHLKSENVI